MQLFYQLAIGLSKNYAAKPEKIKNFLVRTSASMVSRAYSKRGYYTFKFVFLSFNLYYFFFSDFVL